jgi:G3E family GTPase
MTDIYIISGFLGAGKTTLIQKLLKEGFHDKKIVLIENDFGDISVDAALLKDGNIEVREINSGCICCSLSGNFVKAMKELLERFHPDVILIEPSGVGKLSDITKFCREQGIRSLARIKKRITVADVKRCSVYLENFGEFFEDQIKHADSILLSWTENYPDKVKDAYRLIRGLNPNAEILSLPWTKLKVDEVLDSHSDNHLRIERQDTDRCRCGHHLMQNSNHKECGCRHQHSAEQTFETVTIRTSRVFSLPDLQKRILQMEKNTRGTVLRAKGIVRTAQGYLNIQYVPGNIQMTECTIGGNMLCIIGHGLNREELTSLFGVD